MDKTVIITGGSGNLGQAVIKKFLDHKYKIIASAINNTELEKLPDTDSLSAYIADISDEKQAGEFIYAGLIGTNKLQAAIMLVGGFAMGGIEETGKEQLNSMYSLNFETAYFTARPIFSYFKKQNSGGHIILIGARPALDPKVGKDVMSYALSKSQIFSLAEMLNEAGNPHNISASVIVPSIIDTPPNRNAMPDANFDDWVKPSVIADTIYNICNTDPGNNRETIYRLYGNA